MAGLTSEEPDSDSSNKEVLDQFINEKIKKYETSGADDEELWYMYTEDFQDWTTDYFENATRSTVSKLRTTLRQGGVWVTMHKSTKMSKALYNTIHEEERAGWTDIETITIHNAGKPINSNHL